MYTPLLKIMGKCIHANFFYIHVYVCSYVYAHKCMWHVYAYVCYTCLFTCHIHSSKCMPCIFIYVYIYTYVYAKFMHTYIHLYVCVYLSASSIICLFVYLSTYLGSKAIGRMSVSASNAHPSKCAFTLSTYVCPSNPLVFQVEGGLSVCRSNRFGDMFSKELNCYCRCAYCCPSCYSSSFFFSYFTVHTRPIVLIIIVIV